jgi:hypothetical protein
MSESWTVTQLMDWLEGRLPAEEARVMADAVGAVQADSSLTATVNWLRAFLDVAQSTVLVEPPLELSRRAVSYLQFSIQTQRPVGWLQRLVATLTSDSWQRPSLVGVRHAGLGAAPRQLVYEVATADIILDTQVGRTRDSFNISGQIFPNDGADPASFTVQLLSQEIESALRYTDEVGKFTFTGLSAGLYDIIVRGDQAEITIADIEFTV